MLQVMPILQKLVESGTTAAALLKSSVLCDDSDKQDGPPMALSVKEKSTSSDVQLTWFHHGSDRYLIGHYWLARGSNFFHIVIFTEYI